MCVWCFYVIQTKFRAFFRWTNRNTHLVDVNSHRAPYTGYEIEWWVKLPFALLTRTQNEDVPRYHSPRGSRGRAAPVRVVDGPWVLLSVINKSSSKLEPRVSIKESRSAWPKERRTEWKWYQVHRKLVVTVFLVLFRSFRGAVGKRICNQSVWWYSKLFRHWLFLPNQLLRPRSSSNEGEKPELHSRFTSFFIINPQQGNYYAVSFTTAF